MRLARCCRTLVPSPLPPLLRVLLPAPPPQFMRFRQLRAPQLHGTGGWSSSCSNCKLQVGTLADFEVESQLNETMQVVTHVLGALAYGPACAGNAGCEQEQSAGWARRSSASVCSQVTGACRVLLLVPRGGPVTAGSLCSLPDCTAHSRSTACQAGPQYRIAHLVIVGQLLVLGNGALAVDEDVATAVHLRMRLPSVSHSIDQVSAKVSATARTALDKVFEQRTINRCSMACRAALNMMPRNPHDAQGIREGGVLTWTTLVAQFGSQEWLMKRAIPPCSTRAPVSLDGPAAAMPNSWHAALWVLHPAHCWQHLVGLRPNQA